MVTQKFVLSFSRRRAALRSVVCSERLVYVAWETRDGQESAFEGREWQNWGHMILSLLYTSKKSNLARTFFVSRGRQCRSFPLPHAHRQLRRMKKKSISVAQLARALASQILSVTPSGSTIKRAAPQRAFQASCHHARIRERPGVQASAGIFFFCPFATSGASREGKARERRASGGQRKVWGRRRLNFFANVRNVASLPAQCTHRQRLHYIFVFCFGCVDIFHTVTLKSACWVESS